jgi:ElaB/YqjD/DUF883 family membrane-anchored ribosome-binding protein
MESSDKAQSAIRMAQETAKEAGDILSSKLEDIRGQAGTAVRRRSKQAQSASQQGLLAVSEMASQARDAASNASDSIVAYTKKNPVKALAIAAAAGALLYHALFRNGARV